MSTCCTSTELFGNAVRGGFAMPIFGGTAVPGSAGTAAAFGRRERHSVVEFATAAHVVTDVPSDIWADAAGVVATQSKRNPGTQVWSPPT